MRLPSARALNGSRTWADGFELFVLPLIAALLPYALGLRFLRVCIFFTPAYRTQAWLAAQGYQQAGFGQPTQQWMRRVRFVRSVDHLDLYRALLRPARVLLRRVKTHGEWPNRNSALLAITAHWGAGMYSIHELRARGRQVHFLSAPLERGRYGNRVVAFLYARLRMWVTTRVGGAPLIVTGGSFKVLEHALREGRTVVALIDLPPDPATAALRLTALGKPMHVSRGLLRLREVTQCQSVLYSVSVPTDPTAPRIVDISMLLSPDPSVTDTQTGEWLAKLIGRDDAAWHMWQHAPAYFPTTTSP